jgi:cation transport ATPase
MEAFGGVPPTLAEMAETLRAQANVGIAMGTGTDVAIKSGSVTLVKGDLRGIANAIRLSHATMRNVKQNLFFAFVYNALRLRRARL